MVDIANAGILRFAQNDTAQRYFNILLFLISTIHMCLPSPP